MMPPELMDATMYVAGGGAGAAGLGLFWRRWFGKMAQQGFENASVDAFAQSQQKLVDMMSDQFDKQISHLSRVIEDLTKENVKLRNEVRELHAVVAELRAGR